MSEEKIDVWARELSQTAELVRCLCGEIPPKEALPTLLRFYVLHVLFLPFIITIFMAVHFWRVRKDGGISGPL